MDSIKLYYCEKHNEWWSFNCSNCMVDDNEESIKEDGKRELMLDMRDKWCYESAHGSPVFSLKLDDWIEFAKKLGINEDAWWEL